MIEQLSIPVSAVAAKRFPRVAKERDLFADASAEFRMVAICCHPLRSPARISELASLAEVVRWDRVLRLARRHRVMGLVHAALAEIDAIPTEMRDALAKRARVIAVANINSLSALTQITTEFARASVPFVVLKGLPVGQLAYGNAVVRHSKDIDLLLDEDVVDQADELLAALGFRLVGVSRRLTPKQASLWTRFRKHHEYVSERTGIHVEVHWRRSDNIHFSPPLKESSRWVNVSSLQVQVPSPRDMLFDLCLHGASHAWFRLKWLADVAALLAQGEADDGARLLEHARAHDFDRPVEQALLLCSALFPGLRQAVVNKPTRTGLWLSSIASRAMLEETTVTSSAETEFVAPGLKRSRFMLRRSWRYRLEEARVQAASPVDWQTLPMPARLQFLYVFLRLPLWIKRRWWPGNRLRR